MSIWEIIPLRDLTPELTKFVDPGIQNYKLRCNSCNKPCKKETKNIALLLDRAGKYKKVEKIYGLQVFLKNCLV